MSERKFKVILKKLSQAYPEMTGKKALACMLSFERRFIETVAITSANGIDEVLTVKQMQEIFEENETVSVKVKNLTEDTHSWAVAQAAGVEVVVAIPFTDMKPDTSSPDVPVYLLNSYEQKTVRNAVLHVLLARCWSCFGEGALASKSFMTKVGYKDAQIYLSIGDGYNQTLYGEYQSEGRNILAGDSVLIPVGSSVEDIAVLTEKFLNRLEVSISQSYAVKLLNNNVLEVAE